jgi:hypothetical protein
MTKPTGKRVEDTDWEPSASDKRVKKIRFGQFTVEAMIAISERILANKRAWRTAVGVPQGFLIPEKPLPATEEAMRAEVAEISAEIEALTEARERAPLGQEAESLGFHLSKLHQQRWRLWGALHVRKEWAKRPFRR